MSGFREERSVPNCYGKALEGHGGAFTGSKMTCGQAKSKVHSRPGARNGPSQGAAARGSYWSGCAKGLEAAGPE